MADSVPMFPDNEVIVINDNIFIHKHHLATDYRLWLKSGCQYFDIGEPDKDLEHLKWRARMLEKALDKIVLERSGNG